MAEIPASSSPDEEWVVVEGLVVENLGSYDSYGFLQTDESFVERSAESIAANGSKLAHRARLWKKRHLEKEIASQRLGFKRLIRQGIPPSERCAVWPVLLRAMELRTVETPGYWARLCKQRPETAAASASERQIEMDVPRTFPGHKELSTESGSDRLRQVLLGYSLRNASVGYVQGMGFVAGAWKYPTQKQHPPS